MSRVADTCSGYLHHRRRRAGNHYRENAITREAARQKCQRTEAGERIADMQMRQRDVAALDAKYTKELAGC